VLLQIALALARILLAAVFAVAAIAKLADRTGFRQTLADFGIPTGLRPLFVVGLPLCELATAVLLLPSATAGWGAWAALSLLAVFTANISILLVRGKAPACRCFGQVSAAPIGPSTLVRNGILIVVAACVIASAFRNSSPSLITWAVPLSLSMRFGVAAGVVAIVWAGAVIVLLFEVIRQQGRILLRIESLEAGSPGAHAALPPSRAHGATGLPVGAPAPRFELIDLNSRPVSLDHLLALAKPVLLLFVHPQCGPCEALIPEISTWQWAYADVLTVALISERGLNEDRDKWIRHGLSRVLAQRATEISEQYKAYGTPSAVLIGVDGSIASPVASGADAIRALLGRSVAELATSGSAARLGAVLQSENRNGHPSRSPAVKPGDPSPSLTFRDLDGSTIPLAAFTAQQTVLLFWNPACGFCQRMLNDLRAWDAAASDGAPRLVVVSTGTVEDGRAMSLRSPVLLDPSNQAAPAFGASGTPMAILLDGSRIASAVVPGAQAVFALLNAELAEAQLQSRR
jgi:peroxiredoxin